LAATNRNNRAGSGVCLSARFPNSKRASLPSGRARTVMAVSSNQKIGELARIAYLALLHAELELGEETNTFDGDKWSEKLRSIRSAILAMFSDIDDKVDLTKAIYLTSKAGSLVAYYHGGDTDGPDEPITKIRQSSSTSSYVDLRRKEE
jgi:hypothetical protein